MSYTPPEEMVKACLARPRVPDKRARHSNRRAYVFLALMVLGYGAYLATIVTLPVILVCRL